MTTLDKSNKDVMTTHGKLVKNLYLFSIDLKQLYLIT